MGNQLKRCKVCRTEKELTEFHKHKQCSDGVRPYCKTCRSIEAKERYNPQTQHDYHVVSGFGISPEEFQYLWNIQNGECALCFRDLKTVTMKGRLSKPDIDHYHGHFHSRKSQIGCKECIRGLLCHYCNTRYVAWVEKHPQLQSEFVQRYLLQRPLLTMLRIKK